VGKSQSNPIQKPNSFVFRDIESTRRGSATGVGKSPALLKSKKSIPTKLSPQNHVCHPGFTGLLGTVQQPGGSRLQSCKMQIFPLKLRSALFEPRGKSLPRFTSPLLGKEEETSLEERWQCSQSDLQQVATLSTLVRLRAGC